MYEVQTVTLKKTTCGHEGLIMYYINNNILHRCNVFPNSFATTKWECLSVEIFDS